MLCYYINALAGALVVTKERNAGEGGRALWPAQVLCYYINALAGALVVTQERNAREGGRALWPAR